MARTLLHVSQERLVQLIAMYRRPNQPFSSCLLSEDTHLDAAFGRLGLAALSEDAVFYLPGGLEPADYLCEQRTMAATEACLVGPADAEELLDTGPWEHHEDVVQCTALYRDKLGQPAHCRAEITFYPNTDEVRSLQWKPLLRQTKSCSLATKSNAN